MRPIRHPLDRELARARAGAVARRRARERDPSQEPRDRVAERRRDLSTSASRPDSPSTTTSGMPPALVAAIGLPNASASSSTEPIPSSRELRARDVGGGEQRVGVGAISGHVHTCPEVRALRSRVRRRARSGPSPTSSACSVRARVRDARAIARTKLSRILVPDELRDLDDERRRRPTRRATRACRGVAGATARCMSTPSGTTSIRSRATPLASSTSRHGVRDRDDRGGAAVLPARAGMFARSGKSTRRATTSGTPVPSVANAPRPQRHAPCARERRRFVFCECARRRRHAARGSTSDADCSRRPSSPARRARVAERLVRARRDDRRVSAARELAGEPERLSLTAAPAALGVDVQHAQSHGAQLPLFDERTQGRC